MLPKYTRALAPTLERHAFDREAWIRGTEAYKASFDRKQPGYKPPDSFVDKKAPNPDREPPDLSVGSLSSILKSKI